MKRQPSEWEKIIANEATDKQLTDVYIHATSSSSPYIVTARSGDIIHIVRIENSITYWVIYGGTYINAVTVGYVSSGTSVMYAPTLDVENIKSAYVKNASVSGDTLTLTLQDNTTVTFTGGGGGGGSVSIDNTSITENSSNQIQTVGVIDQKTGNANKQWTGTLAQYNALGTHDANTFYNITDDNGGLGLMTTLWTNSSPTSSFVAQTINLSSNNYDYLLIIAEVYKGNGYFLTKIIPKGKTLRFDMASESDGRCCSILRDYTYVNDTQLSVSNATLYTSSGNYNDAGLLVPNKIIGIKVV